ncbi:MAG: 50S ribosomal protein L9 [Patescibacteria group bacterium]
MKVIFIKTKEVKEVALGYAVNYLLPKKLAVLATDKKIQEMEQAKKTDVVKKESSQKDDRQAAERVDGKVVELAVKAGSEGKIHGSVTKKEIAKAFKVLKTQVELPKPIKKLGDYEITLNFNQAKAKVKLKLVEAKDAKK